MVPDDSSLSRRRLLGGLATVVAGGTVTVGATEPTALPDVLTDQTTKVYPTPPSANSHWQPTVTEEHATEAVERLAEVVSEGKKLWKRTKSSDDEYFHGAGGWLENAREALNDGNYYEAQRNAVTGMQYAGEEVGIGRSKLGKADLQTLAERGQKLLARVEEVVESVRPYPVSTPGRDLAWYYETEQELLFARFHADWGNLDAIRDGLDDENGPESSEFDHDAIGSITAKLLQAELYVQSAERFSELLAEQVGGSGTRYEDHLRSVGARFLRRIEEFPSRDEVESKYIGEYDSQSPYDFAHSRLARWCFDYDYRFGHEDNDGLLVYRAVERSKGLAQRRAHEFAVNHLVVETGTEDFDSGHVLAEKQRARSVYQSVVGSNPPPLLTRQVRRAVSDLRVAKVGFGDNYQRPIWRERVKAYIYALVGRAKLKEYPRVYDAIVSK